MARTRVRTTGARLPDELWAGMEPLLLPRPPHPLGCHNPRVPDRAAMDAIFFVLRTGCQWNALERDRHLLVLLGPPPLPGVDRSRGLPRFWRQGLLAYDEMPASTGRGWRWMGRWQGAARRGKNRPEPDGPRQVGDQAHAADRRPGRSARRSRSPGPTGNDHKLMRETLEAVPVERPAPTLEAPQGLCLDKGYDYEEPRALAAIRLHPALRPEGEEREAKRHAGSKARRWVVERTIPGSTASAGSWSAGRSGPDAYLGHAPLRPGLRHLAPRQASG